KRAEARRREPARDAAWRTPPRVTIVGDRGAAHQHPLEPHRDSTTASARRGCDGSGRGRMGSAWPLNTDGSRAIGIALRRRVAFLACRSGSLRLGLLVIHIGAVRLRVLLGVRGVRRGLVLVGREAQVLALPPPLIRGRFHPRRQLALLTQLRDPGVRLLQQEAQRAGLLDGLVDDGLLTLERLDAGPNLDEQRLGAGEPLL